jgi:dTDP-4-dehydrorhamnose reductase
MKALIFGNGWLGRRIGTEFKGFIAKTDITEPREVEEALEALDPDVVINAAGKTGKPNVDSCEKDPGTTLAANVAGPIILAKKCLQRSIFMVHLGSGCVYSDCRPNGEGWTEEDPPNFDGSLYSRSKAFAEKALSEFPVLQLRLRMPFDSAPHPRNLITKLVGYKNVVSARNSLTRVEDLLRVMRGLIERRVTGIWNVVNPGSITHPEILDLYRELVEPQYTYKVMSMSELRAITTAGRSHCVLSSDKVTKAGFELAPVDLALRQALENYRKAVTA